MFPRTLLTFIVVAGAFAVGRATPAAAIVGGGTPSADGIARHVLTLVGSRGNFCSATLVAPGIALTAAHCVPKGSEYKIVEYDGQRRPQLRDISQVAIHPQFNLQTMLAHRATADVALLRLSNPMMAARQLPRVGVPSSPISPGGRFVIAGIGVTVRGDGKSGGNVRSASLIATGRPGNLQIRLVDPSGEGKREGLGACTGDSGAPVFEEQQGTAVLIGVVSWSTGPNGTAGC